jgi:hypothetical protein
MLGPMAAWAKSTGAILACRSRANASRNSARKALRKSRLERGRASGGLFRQTRTMEEAMALEPRRRSRDPFQF